MEQIGGSRSRIPGFDIVNDLLYDSNLKIGDNGQSIDTSCPWRDVVIIVR